MKMPGAWILHRAGGRSSSMESSDECAVREDPMAFLVALTFLVQNTPQSPCGESGRPPIVAAVLTKWRDRKHHDMRMFML